VSNKLNGSQWDEARLISLLKQGDEEAFRVLIRRYQNKLFSVAYGITLDKEESLEILQEVVLKVYMNIRTFREEARLSTWLHRITINQCRNWQRKWRRKFGLHHHLPARDDAADNPEMGSGDDNPDTLYEKKELGKIFRKCLRDLPEKNRTVFVLKEVEGLSYEEIARILKIKQGTVSSRLFYARKKLKGLIKKYENEKGRHNV